MATDRLFNQTQGDSLLAILAQIRDGYNSVDGAFSLTSENPLQNKKITGAVTDIIETLGGTAQKSYAIGQYFLANDGYYYVATAAITAGSSNISSSTGGNCSKTCITAAMNNLSSQISNLNSNKQNTIQSMNVTGTTDNYHSIAAGNIGDKRVIGVRSNTINYSALYTTNQGRMWIKFLDANLNPVAAGASVAATIFYI